MASRRFSRFVQPITCGKCGRRALPPDGVLSDYDCCQECYDALGVENEHNDGHHVYDVRPECPLCPQEAQPAPVCGPLLGFIPRHDTSGWDSHGYPPHDAVRCATMPCRVCDRAAKHAHDASSTPMDAGVYRPKQHPEPPPFKRLCAYPPCQEDAEQTRIWCRQHP